MDDRKTSQLVDSMVQADSIDVHIALVEVYLGPKGSKTPRHVNTKIYSLDGKSRCLILLVYLAPPI